MALMIRDEELERDLRQQREAAGADRWDEVWDGVYVMAAMPNNEHHAFTNGILFALETVLGQTNRGQVFPGVNISDQADDWKFNYRCPDIAVFLPGNPAVDRDSHWLGGPDFAVEIVSPQEDPHEKLDFYGKVNTRELLIVNRRPRRLELFRLTGTNLECVATSEISRSQPGETITSETIPFTWRLELGPNRPRIEVTCTESGQTWHV